MSLRPKILSRTNPRSLTAQSPRRKTGDIFSCFSRARPYSISLYVCNLGVGGCLRVHDDIQSAGLLFYVLHYRITPGHPPLQAVFSIAPIAPPERGDPGFITTLIRGFVAN